MSLLSTTYKILLNILLSRLTPCAEKGTGDFQCGFRRDKSTTERNVHLNSKVTGICSHLSIIVILTPRSRGFSEKITGPQLVRKLPAFYGTRRFIAAFTTASHLSLSLAKTIRSMQPSHLEDSF